MACEFICSDCKGDGTRCRCHEKRPIFYSPREKTRDEILEEARINAERAMQNLRDFVRDNS